jgi:hypothetical protein
MLSVSISADDRHALVLLGMNQPPQIYPYQVLCERHDDGWVESISANGPGWSSTSDPDEAEDIGVLTEWGEAPADARLAVVSFDGREHDASVSDCYYLFVAWDIPASRSAARPVIRRFI